MGTAPPSGQPLPPATYHHHKDCREIVCQGECLRVTQPYYDPPGDTTESVVNHPQHYGGKDNPYEAIKVIRAWDLGFSLGNAVKYISRAGKKDPARHIEDLEKARWYIDEEIEHLRTQQ